MQSTDLINVCKMKAIQLNTGRDRRVGGESMKKANTSPGPVKTQSSSKCLESPERTDGNKSKTKLVSNISISNFQQTGILSKLMQHRGPDHPCVFKNFHFATQP